MIAQPEVSENEGACKSSALAGGYAARQNIDPLGIMIMASEFKAPDLRTCVKSCELQTCVKGVPRAAGFSMSDIAAPAPREGM